MPTAPGGKRVDGQAFAREISARLETPVAPPMARKRDGGWDGIPISE